MEERVKKEGNPVRKILTAYTLSECMDLMAEYTSAFEQSGERNIVFCEDRLTMIAERALTQKMGGSFFSSVSTFARFLKTDKRVLTKQGSIMAVGTIMSSLQKEGRLLCFKSPQTIKNGARAIYETVAQLYSSKVSPEALGECYGKLEEGMLKEKIHDLTLVYQSYQAFLEENGYLDEGGYLSLLPSCIRTSEKIQGATVFFLCYNSFTAQAKEVIRACCETAKNVVGIFIAGKEDLYTNDAVRVFANVLQEYGSAPIVDLGAPIGGEAEILRKSLFDPETLSGKIKRMETNRIHLFEGEEKEEEISYVAANIRKLLAEEEGMRYRDIAVLLSSPSEYELSVKRIFDEYGIPTFFDVKRSLKRHPLGKFLLSILAVRRDNFSAQSVQALLANRFFGESDEYRNYLLKYGAFRGGAKREIKSADALQGYDREKLVACRQRLLSFVEPIRAQDSGEGYCKAIEDILSHVLQEGLLQKLEEETEDVSMKSYLSQIEEALVSLLEEATLLLRGRELSVASFEAVLLGGLESTEISLIPLKMDAVFVGDINDSRIEKAKAIFAVGMTEDVPRSAEDVALISDQEIDRLSTLKTELEPKISEVNLRSRENVALNLCSFTAYLYLTYAQSSKGEAPTKSEVFRYMRSFEKDGKPLAIEKQIDFLYGCSSPVPAMRRLLTEKQAFEKGKKQDQSPYSNLFEALSRIGDEDLESYLKTDTAPYKFARASELFYRGDTLSPSVLEGYALCPFANFASRGLQIKEREETVTLATDSGTFIHDLLETTARRQQDFLSEDEARAFALAEAEKMLLLPKYSLSTDTKSGEYATKSLLFEGVEAAVAVYRQLRGSKFVVEAVEQTVATEDFHGKVDRVDVAKTDDKEYVRVIDYKTGRISSDVGSYYMGKRVQLELYLSAVMKDRTPASVFYFPASVSYQEEENGNFVMQGFLNGDREAILAGDTSLQEGETSRFFKASLDSNEARPAVMSEDKFRDFISYASLVCKQASQEIKSGFIAPTPQGESCAYCKFGGMCGLNAEQKQPRKEKKISVKDIVEIVRKEQGGEK